MESNELIQEAAISDTPVEVPIVPEQNRKKRIFIIAAAVFLFLIIASISLYLRNTRMKQTGAVDSATKTLTPNLSSTATITGEKTSPTAYSPSLTITPIPSTTLLSSYSNKILEIMFMYPPDYEITENLNNPTQGTVTLTLGDTYIRFDRFTADSENEAPYNQTDVTEMHNEITWKVVSDKQEASMCLNVDCERVPSYYMYKNGYRYSFTYSPYSLKNVVEDLLSSFSFLEFVAQ